MDVPRAQRRMDSSARNFNKQQLELPVHVTDVSWWPGMCFFLTYSRLRGPRPSHSFSEFPLRWLVACAPMLLSLIAATSAAFLICASTRTCSCLSFSKFSSSSLCHGYSTPTWKQRALLATTKLVMEIALVIAGIVTSLPPLLCVCEGMLGSCDDRVTGFCSLDLGRTSWSAKLRFCLGARYRGSWE